jgi:hypothetical protein
MSRGPDGALFCWAGFGAGPVVGLGRQWGWAGGGAVFALARCCRFDRAEAFRPRAPDRRLPPLWENPPTCAARDVEWPSPSPPLRP